MRRTSALAASALLALVACGLSGCDWIGSLTPFGIGTRDYAAEAAANNLNGNWVGTTASGGAVEFQIGNSTITHLELAHVASGCTIFFEGGSNTINIVDGMFSFERDLEGQGRIAIQGSFPSSITCTGSYSFQALPASVCPTAGTGTFSAEKTL